MAEGALRDRLDRTIDAIVQRRDATSALRDRELAPLARFAADLRHFPGLSFKARLRADLERKVVMSSALIGSQVREGLSTITPYVKVGTAGLFEFLARVFGAVETSTTRVSAGLTRREVQIGTSTIVIEEGEADGMAPSRPAEFHVYVEDADVVFQRALANGATSLGEPADRPYGERAGFVRDALGNHWFIATHRGISHVPEGVGTVTPFIHAKGASEYIDFLKRAFGAVEEQRDTFGAGLVRFSRLRIGNAAIELGEAEAAGAAMPGAFYVNVTDVDRLYAQSVAAGARPLSPPAIQGDQSTVGRVEDPVGNLWLIAGPA